MPDELLHKGDIAVKDRLFIKLIIFAPCLMVLFRSLDNDIWWLLNSGRYVLQHGIPHIEPFTIHQGFHFVMQSWLSSVIFWVTYSHLGAVGIKVLVMLFYIMMVYIFYKLCMKVSENYFLVSFVVSFAAGYIISCDMTSRPYIFSTFFFALEVFLLESYRLSNKIKYILFLPLFSVLLINLQAAMWPMLFVLLIPYVIESFKFKIGPFVSPGAEKKVLFSVIAAMIAVGFINPYGLEAMTYLARTYGIATINEHIREMQPADITIFLGQLTFAGILAVILIFTKHGNGKKRLRYTLLAIGTAYLALSAIRSLPLFAICAFFPMAAYLKDFEPKIKQEPATKKTLQLRKILIVLIVITVTGLLVITNDSYKVKNRDIALLKNTIDYIIKNEDVSKVTLFTEYKTGGMAEFKGIPGYMDARAEVFVKKENRKADVLDEYFNMQSGAVYYKDVLNKYHFTHILLTKDGILNVYLPHDSDYKLVYSNENYNLYERIK